VVVSVPPPVVASGALSFDPSLDARKAEAAAAIPLGSVIRIVAQLREEAPSTGSLVSIGTEGGFWSIDDRMVIVWVGGPSASRFSGTDPIDIVLHASAAFAWLDRSRIGDVLAADWGADPFSLGGYSYPRAGALDAPAIWGEPVEETVFFCGEGTCGDVHPATVHGAIESGRRVGAEVAAVFAR
jgi:monoamine oxidase